MSDLHIRAFELEFDRPITRRERWMIKNIVNKVYLGEYERPGWTGKLGFYLFKCKKHGLVADYKHGVSQRLACPICTTTRLQDKEPTPEEEHENILKTLRKMED